MMRSSEEIRNCFLQSLRLGRMTLRGGSYELLNKELGIYKIYQEEIYRPKFEDEPKITGVRIFTISTVKGFVYYESKGSFEKKWY